MDDQNRGNQQPQMPPPPTNNNQNYGYEEPALPQVKIDDLPPTHPDFLHPVADTPKHTYRPKLFKHVLIAVLVISILGVSFAVAYTLMPGVFNGKTDNQSTKNTNTANTTPKLTAEKEIERIRAYFKGTEKARTSLTTPIRTKGNNFYTVIPDASQVISIAGELTPDKVSDHLTAIHKVLDYDKFKQKILQDGVGTNNYLADYVHDDVICQLSAIKQADPKASQFVEAKCLNITQYEEYAKIQRPFYNVYAPGQATSVEIAFTGKPSIQASQTPGYHFTELPVGSVIDNQVTTSGTMAMFYQTPDNIWHYFKDRAQRLIECEQYNTDPLKYAYVNQPCRSLAKDIDMAVKLPPKRR